MRRHVSGPAYVALALALVALVALVAAGEPPSAHAGGGPRRVTLREVGAEVGKAFKNAHGPNRRIGGFYRLAGPKLLGFARASAIALVPPWRRRLNALPTLEVERDALLGFGIEKAVYSGELAGVGPVVVLDYHRFLPWTLAETQLETHAALVELGLPVAPFLGKVAGRGGRFHLVQPRLAGSSRDLIAALDAGDTVALATSPLNRTSIKDLVAIRRRLLATRSYVPDLQFLVAADGHVVINDTDRPRRGELAREDLRQLDGLLAAAYRAVELRPRGAAARRPPSTIR